VVVGDEALEPDFFDDEVEADDDPPLVLLAGEDEDPVEAL